MIRAAVIAGPTAAGKTGLAVEVAHRLGSEIVSVDSRQVYRGLDLGAGKDLEEYSRCDPPVPVHLVDVADPAEVYTVFQFQRDCYRVLEEAAARPPFREGTPIVLAGGTGLYLEAVLRGYRIPNVPGDEGLREELMREEKGALAARLAREEPDLAAATDMTSKKRIVRALEIAARAGREGVPRSRPAPVRLDATVFLVEIDRGRLHERIDARLDDRLARGLVGEVRGLLDGGLPPARLGQLGLEYREVGAYLAGEKSYEGMVEDLRRGIRRFAKRQQTWFRGMERRGISLRRVAPGDAGAVLASLAR